MLSALLFALALIATPTGSFPAADFDEEMDSLTMTTMAPTRRPNICSRRVTMSLESHDTAQQLRVLWAITEDIAESVHPEEAMRYVDPLRTIVHLLGQTQDSHVTREAVELLVQVARVGARATEAFTEEGIHLLTTAFVQLLDHNDERVVRAAALILSRTPTAYGLVQGGVAHVTPPGLADVFFEYGAVSKLSPLLLSNDHLMCSYAVNATFVALTALHQTAHTRPQTIPTCMAQTIQAEVIPNSITACGPGSHKKALTEYIPFMSCLSFTSCLLPWKWGNESAVSYAVDQGCVGVACDLLESSKDRMDVKNTLAVLSNLFVRAAVTDLYRLPRSIDLLSSPWAPWVAGTLAVLLGLSALWRFVVGPWLQRHWQRRQQRQAEDTATQLIAEEETVRNRGQGRGRRGHARHPNAASAARRPADQPSSSAGDDGGMASTAASSGSHSGCLTPTSSGDGSAHPLQQEEHQEEPTPDDGGEWTAAARHRKKKSRKGGTTQATSRQDAGQSSSSRETAPRQQAPSTAMRKSPPRPLVPPLVSPSPEHHSSPYADRQQAPERAGVAPAAAHGNAFVGAQRGQSFAGRSSSSSGPSDDSAWVRGVGAAWSQWGSGQGGGHHSQDPTERQRRAEAAAADDAHSVDPARAMALEQKQQAVDRLQELRCELDGKLAAIASLEQRKTKLIREKETAMVNAPKSVDELDEVVRAGGVEGIRQFSAEAEAEKAALQPIYDAALAKIRQLSSGSAAVEEPHMEREQDTATEGAAAASGSSSADAGGLCGPLEGSSSGAGVADDIGGLGLGEQLAKLTQRISEVEQQLGSGELDRRLRCLSHEVGKLQSRVDAIRMDTHNRPSMACLSSIHTEENRQLQRRIDDREDDESCAVCHDGQRTVVLIGKAPSTCRHRCLCVTCWHTSYAPGRGNTQCPICRSDIDYRKSGPTI
ncbi:unnamed protein product [Vitrella brassicaformis CCMP3155]|uniref:RING-type domain-containing protein n=1 Tax=Vitrella brassicaformis (strain CCMP3155) TaxID=1169540 RepID=A0A0G4GVC8_VITBC|nr:unnamed protein product [Vitrella brassicaformis CCMP3155]|eukprot:CEM34801.1 unnamed protein product [Vitrella brassicaformis CCMP3155]